MDRLAIMFWLSLEVPGPVLPTGVGGLSGPDSAEGPRGGGCGRGCDDLGDGHAVRGGDLEAVVPRLAGGLPLFEDAPDPVAAAPPGDLGRPARGSRLSGDGFIDQHETTP